MPKFDCVDATSMSGLAAETVMGSTIIVTGNALAPRAMGIAEKREARVLTIKPYAPPAELAAFVAAENADAIIVRAAHVTDEVMAASPRLKVIVKHGIGVDTIDLASATKRKIPVLITHGANAQSVAEHAFGLMFAVSRQSAWLDSRMRAGHWDKATSFGGELLGKTLGVVGLGSIGRALIDLVQPLKMRVVGLDPFVTSGLNGVELVGDVDTLLRASDIVSLHMPLTDTTRNLIDKTRLGLMRRGAILINTARGGLIDHEALAVALSEGALTGAGIDCFPSEPPKENPLSKLANVVMTPHIGANTREAAERVGVRAVEQALDTIDGKPFDPRANVNPGYATA